MRENAAVPEPGAERPVLSPALAAKARRGELGGAFLLTGAPDPVLEDQARALAAALLCRGETPPCGSCRACRKVSRGIHPDVIWVERLPDKTQLSVDQIRQVRADAYVRPNEAPRKVYVIRRAWQMNAAAQNALLKVLEEGPVYAVFLLLAPNDAALLPTIRSRCERVAVSGRDRAEGEADRQAEELAELLLGEDEWRRVGWCAAREKGSREETIQLWERTRQALLARRGPGTDGKVVRLARRLQEMEDFAPSANLGILWGSLLAACAQAE